jgi:mono/diheme cytochrome c family protein
VRPRRRAGADGAGAAAPGRVGALVRVGLIVGAVAVALAACASTPEAAPTTTVAVSLERGREVYAAKCAQCHGLDLRGTDQGPSHLAGVYAPAHHSDESFRRAVRVGAPQHHWRFGPMPPIDGVSDADLESVIAYVRAQQRERGFSN